MLMAGLAGPVLTLGGARGGGPLGPRPPRAAGARGAPLPAVGGGGRTPFAGGGLGGPRAGGARGLASPDGAAGAGPRVGGAGGAGRGLAPVGWAGAEAVAESTPVRFLGLPGL
jgi:translation initiation factor IF-2